MGHVILLGDSILDNGAYVSGGSPIHEQLRSRSSREWRVTLLARDGAVTTDIQDQLQRLPADATHLIVSVGGNDALENTFLFNSPTPDSVDLLAELVAMQTDFRACYQRMLSALRGIRLPTLACTIYDAVPGLDPVERMALSLYNDVIVHEIIAARLPVLDLRLICNEHCDFSSISPIEPSEIGGFKISRAVQRVLLAHDFSLPDTVVYR